MTSSSLLKGVAFITGAASGIGKATAYSLARHGITKLAITDINLAAAEKTASTLKSDLGGHIHVLPLKLDVTNEQAVAETVSTIVKEFGRIDVAVNNAGVGGPAVPSADHPYEEWKKTLDIDLNGVWLTSREEIRQMLKQEPLVPSSPRHPRGTIVNIASMYGIVATNLNTPVVSYTAAKHGVVGLTKADAVAYAPRGIKINALCPGYVLTPLMQEHMKGEMMQKELEKTPMGRMATMEEMGDHVVMLASPLGSFMCGAALVADGGFTVQ